MWLLFPLAAVAGAGLYELLRPSPKTGVVQFTQDIRMVNANEAALKAAGIDYVVKNDGMNIWILVSESNRPKAVELVISSARAAGLIK